MNSRNRPDSAYEIIILPLGAAHAVFARQCASKQEHRKNGHIIRPIWLPLFANLKRWQQFSSHEEIIDAAVEYFADLPEN